MDGSRSKDTERVNKRMGKLFVVALLVKQLKSDKFLLLAEPEGLNQAVALSKPLAQTLISLNYCGLLWRDGFGLYLNHLL